MDLRDYVDFDEREARRTRVYATERLATDLWCIEPQQATPAMVLDADVTYTVVGGRSWFVTEDGEIGLDPLGAMLVPAGVAHGIDNRGMDPLIVLAVVSPPGEDTEDAPVAEGRGAVRIEDPDATSPLRRALRGLFGG